MLLQKLGPLLILSSEGDDGREAVMLHKLVPSLLTYMITICAPCTMQHA